MKPYTVTLDRLAKVKQEQRDFGRYVTRLLIAAGKPPYAALAARPRLSKGDVTA